MLISDELSAAKDTGARGDEGDAELEEKISEIAKIEHGTKDSDNDHDMNIDLEAASATDEEDEEIEGIDEKGERGEEKKDLVPADDDAAAWIEDAVVPGDGATVQSHGEVAPEGEKGGGSDDAHRGPSEVRKTSAGRWREGEEKRVVVAMVEEEH